MISFFKINDPYRIIIVFLFLIVVQIPYVISGQVISIPEIEWQTIGKALASGKSMYTDVYHNTGPLAAWTYWIVTKFFPDNYLIFKILGLVLILFQAIIFNMITIEHKTHNQNTYVPAFIYAVLMAGLTDFITLSPQLLAMTFILLSIDLIFRHIEGRKKKDWVLLQIGIYLGISTLFYPLTFWILLAVFISLIFYTNTIFKRYFLLFFGYAIPLILVWLKYFWFDQLNDLYMNLSQMIFPIRSAGILPWSTIFAISAVPFLFFILAAFKIYNSNAFINYQVRLQNFFLIYLISGLVILFSDPDRTANILVIFNPGIAFFLSHYFQLFRKKVLAEIYFLFFFSAILALHYGISYRYLDKTPWINFDKNRYSISENPFKDSKVLVIGNDSHHYYQAELATPFLSWPISKQYFEEINTYSSSIRLYNSFKQDYPDVVIDEHDKMKQLMDIVPEIKDTYHEESPGIYMKEN